MPPEKTDPNNMPEYAPDLFDEPRDHANQWDISAFWTEEERVVDPKLGPVVE